MTGKRKAAFKELLACIVLRVPIKRKPSTHLENLILEKQEGRKDAKAKEAKKEADSS